MTDKMQQRSYERVKHKFKPIKNLEECMLCNSFLSYRGLAMHKCKDEFETVTDCTRCKWQRPETFCQVKQINLETFNGCKYGRYKKEKRLTMKLYNYIKKQKKKLFRAKEEIIEKNGCTADSRVIKKKSS